MASTFTPRIMLTGNRIISSVWWTLAMLGGWLRFWMLSTTTWALRGTTSPALVPISPSMRSEEHTSELQSLTNLVCRLLLEKKKKSLLTKELYRNPTNRAHLRRNQHDKHGLKWQYLHVADVVSSINIAGSDARRYRLVSAPTRCRASVVPSVRTMCGFPPHGLAPYHGLRLRLCDPIAPSVHRSRGLPAAAVHYLQVPFFFFFKGPAPPRFSPFSPPRPFSD